MDTLDTKRMEMFIRVLANRAELALVAAEGSHAAGLFDELGQVTEDLRARAYDQSRGQSSMRESTGSVAAARDELVRQMDAIRRTVRVYAGDANPGLEDKFRPTHGVSDQELIILARTYGNDAFPFKAELIKRGLGADLIADLDVATLALDESLNERTKRRGRRRTATTKIDLLVGRGLQIARELDVIARNIYANDSSKLALWESVSHIEKPPRKSRKKDNNNQPPPPTGD